MLAPGRRSIGLRAGDDVPVRPVALGRADHDAHARLGADLGEGVRHVVAVTGVDELDALQTATMLEDGERIGHALAWVMRIGEAVDHGYLAVLGEVFDVLLGEGTDHDAVDVPAQHVGGVLDGLADAQLDVAGAQEHRLSAELLDADLEAHARTRARLHEDHRHSAPGKERMRRAALLGVLERGGQVEQGDDFGGREVVDREEAAAGEVELGEVALCLLGHGTPFSDTDDGVSPRKRRDRRSRGGERMRPLPAGSASHGGYQMNLRSRRMSSSVGLPISCRS